MAIRTRASTALTKEVGVEQKVVSIMKDMPKKGMDNISPSQMVKAVPSICPEEIKMIKTSEGALSRSFNIGHFNAPNKIHLQIRGYVDFYGGYAKHAREVLRYLDDTGRFCLRLNAIPSPREIDPILASKMDWYSSNPAFITEGSKFLVIAGPGHTREDKVPKDSRFKIGWTMVETRGVQPQIVGWLNNMNEIWAPTEVDFDRFVKAGVRNVYRVPLGYDSTMWHPTVAPIKLNGLENRYVFGVLGSWNVRKGVREIIQAYVKAFNKNDLVTLLLVCKYGTRKWGSEEDKLNDERWCIQFELNQIIEEMGLKKEDCPHIALMDVPTHPNVLPHIASRFDALVGFSKGESTWLPGIEIGAMKKPIIQLSSECSGFMEYLSDNRYMCKDVRYELANEELSEGTSEYYTGQEMAEGNVQELSEMMKQVRMEHGSVVQSDVVNEIYYDKLKHRDWKNVVEIILDRLQKQPLPNPNKEL